MERINDTVLRNSFLRPVEIKFHPEIATILLSFDKKSLNKNTEEGIAKNMGLLEKDEIHFTIIGSQTGQEILNVFSKLDQTNQNKTRNKIVELCKSFDWKISLKEEYYYIKKTYELPQETRESIIQIIGINQIQDFYKQLNTLLGKQFAVPFPHITLYTTSTIENKKLRGIGIYSKEQFEELTPQKI